MLDRWRAAAGGRWRAARIRHHWLDHVVVAWHRFSDNHGNQLAGAITYFSFLALFPLILLGVAVAGYVLRANPEQLASLRNHITSAVPGAFGETLTRAIDQAIAERTSVGIVGLVGLLLTGLGWVANLRAAINAVWGTRPPQRNIVLRKLADLLVLAGIGVAALASLALTVAGTRLTDLVLRAVGLADVAGSHLVTRVLGIALAVLGDMLVFVWLLVRLPRARVPPGLLVRGALLAAIGYEIFKIVGTYYIARVTRSPTAGLFGSVIGILVWIDLVSRYLLYCAAWTATGALWDAPDRRPVAIVPPRPQLRVSPLGVAASLVGAGMALGGGAVAWLATHRRRRARHADHAPS